MKFGHRTIDNFVEFMSLQRQIWAWVYIFMLVWDSFILSSLNTKWLEILKHYESFVCFLPDDVEPNQSFPVQVLRSNVLNIKLQHSSKDTLIHGSIWISKSVLFEGTKPIMWLNVSTKQYLLSINEVWRIFCNKNIFVCFA